MVVSVDPPPPSGLQLVTSGRVVYWRGPSPYHFVPVDDEGCAAIHEVAPLVTYGWGVVPVSAQLGNTTFTTSLLPKNGGYLLPLKDAVRRAEGVECDDLVTVHVHIEPRR